MALVRLQEWDYAQDSDKDYTDSEQSKTEFDTESDDDNNIISESSNDKRKTLT